MLNMASVYFSHHIRLFQAGFHTVPLSTLRVLVMMIGELDFGATFVDTSSNQNPSNPFPSVAYICLFLCLFLLSVGLMNLLVRKHPYHIMIHQEIKPDVAPFCLLRLVL